MRKEQKDLQYYKFCLYGLFKNLRFFEPFFLLFFLEKGISFLQIGTLYAIREIAILILEIPTGIFADLLGRRKTMIVSFLSYIVSFSIFYFSTQYIFLATAMITFSIGDAMRTGTHKAMIFDYLKLNNWHNDKVNYYGHTRSWSQIGSALSSIIAAFIVIYFGNYKPIFLISTIPYIADLILVNSYPRILDGPLKKDISGFNIRLAEYLKHIKTNFSKKDNWQIFLNTSVYQGAFKAIKDYLQPLIIISIYGALEISETNNRSSLIIGITYFIIYIISSLISRYSGQLAKQFTSLQKALNTSLLIGFAIFIASGLLSIYHLFAPSIIIFIIIFVLQNFRKPVGASLIAQNTSADILATSLSIQSLFDALFTATIAIAIGFVADQQSVEIAILSMGLILLITYPVFRLKNK